MFERKPRKIVAPDGYIYRKGEMYATVIYPLPSQDVSDYELVPIEEYEATLVTEETESEVMSDEA
jgi:hypothetical protein